MSTRENIRLIARAPLQCTLKPVLSSHSKIGKAKILMTDGSLMKVKSIAGCILQYF